MGKRRMKPDVGGRRSSDPRTAATVRFEHIEQRLDRQDEALDRIGESLNKLVEVSERQQQMQANIQRLEVAGTDSMRRVGERLESIERTLVGADGNPGIVGRLKQTEDSTSVHSKLFWLIGGTFATELLAVVIWALNLYMKLQGVP